MPSGHGRDGYTFERMMERRNRNNIRRVLERNGRRLTAREIDIVNLCTRYPDQRYTLFSYYCDTNCMQLNPYILPHLPVPDHHKPHCPQQPALGSSNSDRSVSTSVVAPLLFQMNMDANATNSSTDGPSQSDRPSTSRVILPCYLLTDGTDAPASSGIGFNSTVNLIADTIIESLKSGSDKGNSEKDNSDKGDDENGNSNKAKPKKSSRKNSKKKKKNKKRGGAKAGPSETQIRSNNNPSDEPCVSSGSSSCSHVEISLVDDGNGCAQRVKSDTEAVLRCFSSNSLDQCHVDVSSRNSMLSGDEGEDIELALTETVGPAEFVANEDLSVHEEMDKANRVHCSSDACISNDFIPVVSGRRGKCGRRSGQQGGNNQFVAFSTCSSDRLSTWQEKPSKFATNDKPAPHIIFSKPRDLGSETTMTAKSSEKTDTTGKFDLKQDANPGPIKPSIYSRNDNEISSRASRHLGEHVFKKDEFPRLPPPNSGLKEVVRHKMDPWSRLKDNLKKSAVLLSRKVPEQCKESENEDAVNIKICIPNLEVKVGEMEESGSGSRSSSGAFFSPDSSKSSQMNQSSHDTSGLDSPRSSKASDETSLRLEVCSSSTKEGNDENQTGHGICTLDDKSSTDMAHCSTFPSDLSNNAPTDIDASRSSSSMCSSPASTTSISPTAIMPRLNIGELKNMAAECSPNLREVLWAVQAAHTVYLMSELVQTTFGGPFADYELLCHYAAPIVDVPPHQIANVPLQKIWQWYEEPSCYALEVRGCQDHYNLIDFTAHFVPSLSAVQLFVRRSPSVIFSKHLSNWSGLEYDPGVEDVLGVDAESAELVYEFFEFEQPYLRQPLFEKVKQLLGGVVQGRSHFNGDAKHLEQLRLGDLHPASWYCVAWYPAYRIPVGRGSFKAAFLTYHSLAHFVQGATGPSVDNGVNATSFPVVGLMCYNTEGESWYHERYQSQDVIRARVNSFNLTAAVMARARVMRGHQNSRNHHPDFEFFASRRYNNYRR